MSLLTSVQESQPGYSYYSNVSGGGGGGAGSFTTLNVTGQTTVTNISATNLSVSGITTLGAIASIPLGTLYSQRQTLSATLGESNITFNGITVFNGTFACTVRGADNLSFYSAMASLYGNASTGAGQDILKIGDSSNVAADPSSAFSFIATEVDGEWDWSPIFTSSVVTSGSNFTCTLSPNFG
jgi:hypothetical protein